MVDIINLILFVVIAIALIRFCIWLSKRINTVIKLNSLKRECGAYVTYLRCPFFPTSFMSKKPDIMVEILNTVYLIKLYSGGTGKFVHFADSKYSVRFSKLRAGRFVVNTRWRSGAFSAYSGSFNVGVKVFVLPNFPTPENLADESCGKNVEKILLFTPAPNEVSYVTEEKTTIKLAFTGDEFYGMKIFSTSSFIAYADRETRKNDELMYF